MRLSSSADHRFFNAWTARSVYGSACISLGTVFWATKLRFGDYFDEAMDPHIGTGSLSVRMPILILEPKSGRGG